MSNTGCSLISPRQKAFSAKTGSRRILEQALNPLCRISAPQFAGIALSLCSMIASGAEPKNADWPVYLGGKSRSLYSPLQQINRDNVSQLEVAWSYDTGDKSEYQANNLIVDGVLYTPSPTRKVIALDAATGRELWKWDPANERSGKGPPRQRGLVYWKSDTGEDRRLFTGVGGFLFALDPKTGDVVRSFGENGSVNLGSGLNTPGVIHEDLLILGGVGGKGAAAHWISGPANRAGSST